MATFPALAPVRRRYGLRDTSRRSAGPVRFRMASQRFGPPLELSYELLTQAEAQLLRDHYRGQLAGLAGFRLSTAAWAGHTSQTDLIPAWHWWLWAEQPEEQQRAGGLVDVVCRLRSTPIPASP